MDELKGLPAHKRPEFVKAFGEERVKQIEDAIETRAKEADAAGIEKKEQPVPAPVPETPAATEPPMTRKEVVDALAAVVETIAAQVEAKLKELAAKPTEEVKEAPKAEPVYDLVQLLKARSVIGNPAARVDGRTKEAKDGPEEAVIPSGTQEAIGMRINILDKVFQANEAWATQKNGKED